MWTDWGSRRKSEKYLFVWHDIHQKTYTKRDTLRRQMQWKCMFCCNYVWCHNHNHIAWRQGQVIYWHRIHNLKNSACFQLMLDVLQQRSVVQCQPRGRAMQVHSDRIFWVLRTGQFFCLKIQMSVLERVDKMENIWLASLSLRQCCIYTIKYWPLAVAAWRIQPQNIEKSYSPRTFAGRLRCLFCSYLLSPNNLEHLMATLTLHCCPILHCKFKICHHETSSHFLSLARRENMTGNVSKT